MNISPDTIDIIITLAIALLGGRSVLFKRALNQHDKTAKEAKTEAKSLKSAHAETQKDLQLAHKKIGEQELAMDEQALSQKVTQKAFDSLSRRFDESETERGALSGEVRVLKVEHKTLENAFEEERAKRITAETKQHELEQTLEQERQAAAIRDRAKDEKIQALEQRSEENKAEIKKLTAAIKDLSKPDPPPPVKVVNPNFTPDEEEDKPDEDAGTKKKLA